ncbi:MAG TPA: biopolymer transporter ExbD [Acidobacteriaceae bacterium]|nr:biopolymer transporter ExbD [Acidobacteriaceae bacterium]
MTVSDARVVHADPNVTPLIDVLLVLLIIFMVIVPAAPKGLATLVPEPPNPVQPAPLQPIVLRVLAGPSGALYQINGASVAGKTSLAAELNRIFSTRASRILFVQGDPGLSFASVAQVIDISRATGIDRVAILTQSLAAR